MIQIKIQISNKVQICRNVNIQKEDESRVISSLRVIRVHVVRCKFNERIRVFLSRTKRTNRETRTVRQTLRKGRKFIHGKSRVCPVVNGGSSSRSNYKPSLAKFREFLCYLTRHRAVSRYIRHIVQKVNVVRRKLFCTVHDARIAVGERLFSSGALKTPRFDERVCIKVHIHTRGSLTNC